MLYLVLNSIAAIPHCIAIDLDLFVTIQMLGFFSYFLFAECLRSPGKRRESWLKKECWRVVMSVYQFLEKVVHQEKKGYLSVYVDKSLRREQDGGSLVYI